MANIAGRDINNNDLGVMGGGVLVLLASFFNWYGYSAGGFSAGISGWSAGFTAWFSILLCIIVAGAVAARVFGGQTIPSAGPVGPALLGALVSALAVLLIIIRWATLPSGGGGGFGVSFHYGARFGLFLGLIGAIVEAAFGFLSFKSSGESMPDFKGGSGAPPAA